LVMNTTQIILQFGGFGVIAVMFALVLRWLLVSIDRSTEQTTKTTTAFIETANAFNQTANDFNATVINHMVHSDESFKELTMAIEKLCEMWNQKS